MFLNNKQTRKISTMKTDEKIVFEREAVIVASLHLWPVATTAIGAAGIHARLWFKAKQQTRKKFQLKIKLIHHNINNYLRWAGVYFRVFAKIFSLSLQFFLLPPSPQSSPQARVSMVLWLNPCLLAGFPKWSTFRAPRDLRKSERREKAFVHEKLTCSKQSFWHGMQNQQRHECTLVWQVRRRVDGTLDMLPGSWNGICAFRGYAGNNMWMWNPYNRCAKPVPAYNLFENIEPRHKSWKSLI